MVAFHNWDELSPFQNGTSCRLGQFVAFWYLGQIVAWDELSSNLQKALMTQEKSFKEKPHFEPATFWYYTNTFG